MTPLVGFCNQAMTWCRNESISDVPFQLDIAAVTARIEAGASHLYTAKLLNGVYFVMLLKWRMFPSFNSTLKSKYLLTPAPPDMFSNDKMQKKFVLLWMVNTRLGKEVPKSWRATEIIPDLYHDDELRSSWSKLRSSWPHLCIGDSKLRPQPCSFSKLHFNIITIPTSSHSVYLEDTESSTHHHTPISQSPANINNRMFSIAI